MTMRQFLLSCTAAMGVTAVVGLPAQASRGVEAGLTRSAPRAASRTAGFTRPAPRASSQTGFTRPAPQAASPATPRTRATGDQRRQYYFAPTSQQLPYRLFV